MRGISWLAVNQLASQEGLCTMEYYISYTACILRSSFPSLTSQPMYVQRKKCGTFLQPFLQWESNKYYLFWVCVCSLRFPARNAHAPYCHLWHAPLYNIFPHYFINGTIFEKKVTEHKMCVLIFSTTFASNISHSKKNSAGCDYKCMPVFMYVLSEFNKTWIFSTDFLKPLKYQISWKSV